MEPDAESEEKCVPRVACLILKTLVEHVGVSRTPPISRMESKFKFPTNFQLINSLLGMLD